MPGNEACHPLDVVQTSSFNGLCLRTCSQWICFGGYRQGKAQKPRLDFQERSALPLWILLLEIMYPTIEHFRVALAGLRIRIQNAADPGNVKPGRLTL